MAGAPIGGAGAAWLAAALAVYDQAAKEKLAGPGDREAAIRGPIEGLLGAAGRAVGVPAVFHDEVQDTERRVRPDYGVSVAGVITGYVEVKAPGRSIDPDRLRGHDLQQWERQRDLPNLLYTNGTEWRLYRDSEPVGEPVRLAEQELGKAPNLAASAELEALLTNFLTWEPADITTVSRLVRAVAPLTRLLRGEVMDSLVNEQAAVRAGASARDQPFTGLANDWRGLLFPNADDVTFADGYAQTVTFALLLARSDGVDLTQVGLHEVGARLDEADHGLMGRALQLLTDVIAADFKVTLDLLVRVVGAVDWDRIRRGRRDEYIYLYEHFLDEYDPELRKASGSYYTPREVVTSMVRLTDDVLRTRLGKPAGFADEGVVTVDPAMGTGTYLHEVIEHVAAQAEAEHGPGVVEAAVTSLAKRLVGFELQMGPYAVAQLRAADLVRAKGAAVPKDGLQMFVTDTLDNPEGTTQQLSSTLWPIARSRELANEVKRRSTVTVAIGNPPYRERAEGLGGWVEAGDPPAHVAPPLDAFRAPGNGAREYVLKNLYVYFWRWATNKVFDFTPDPSLEPLPLDYPDVLSAGSAAGLTGDAGVVCFITTSGYLRGPGFRGMRHYLRRRCSDAWIIDVSPEGIRPDVATRLFPGVQQPLAIGLFVRAVGTDDATPARVRYRLVEGRRKDKLAALAATGLDDGGWRDARTDWQAPFTPAAATGWDDYPAMDDLMPWTAPGVKANRTWVIAPSENILERRWRALVTETDQGTRAALFKESRDASLSKAKDPLPGVADLSASGRPFAEEAAQRPVTVPYGFRAFDRQHVVADRRVLHGPSPTVWAARQPGQVFVVEQHSTDISDGPGLVFSSLIPDMHHYNNRGGRTLPLLHQDGVPNLAPGLVEALSGAVSGPRAPARPHQGDEPIRAGDVLAYIAGVVAHPAFTRTHADQLTTPGVRVPVTADPQVWAEAVAVGREVVWAHTFGAIDPAAETTDAGSPSGGAGSGSDVRFPQGDPRRVMALKAPSQMPATMSYDAGREVLLLGDGEWGPVPRVVFDYAVGGKSVLKSWFAYRKASPGGRRSSPLDDMHVDDWPGAWTVELIEVLSVLRRLVELEERQSALLDAVLAGPLLSMADLAGLGVQWPATPADRRPRPVATSASEGNQLQIRI